ncbi:MAG: hypothetical protein HGB03_01825 [Candidatus Yonathbacteria bacterium]|nr:hypothetical protein [Candidatus Yonathbacteria bacterium]NTW47998.1 hypothetical protein [Candidatus Yonathbacteria bacterium]
MEHFIIVIVLQHENDSRDFRGETQSALTTISSKKVFVIATPLSSQAIEFAKNPEKHVELVVWHYQFQSDYDDPVFENAKELLRYGTPVLLIRSNSEPYQFKQRMNNWIKRLGVDEKELLHICSMPEYPETVWKITERQISRKDFLSKT